jgi:predicted transposase YdaD
MSGPARNEPCSCGSGKKYKKCHYLIAHQEQERYYAEMRERAAREAAQAQAERQKLIEQGRSIPRRRSHAATAALLALAVMK